MRGRRHKRALNVLIALTAFAVLAIELYPIGITVLNGFRRDIVILSGRPFQLSQLTLRSYQLVLGNRQFVEAMRNSLVIGLVSTGVSVLAGAMASATPWPTASSSSGCCPRSPWSSRSTSCSRASA
jgi:ABC-type spermidine/putrescine transport system permease subunit II